MTINIAYNAASDASGYSQCARDYIFALDNDENFAVKYKPFSQSDNIDGAGIDHTTAVKLNRLSQTKIEQPYINICHCIPDRFSIDTKAVLNIGYTVTEAETIPKHWTFLCNQMDAIFTCSTFCKKVFQNNGVNVPVFVIPHCHDTELITNEKYTITNLKSFNFLFMADLTPRKGYKQLLRAYCEEFDKGEDVSLTMKVYSNGFTQKEQNACKARIKKHARSMGYEINKNTPTIYFYGNCLPNDCVSRFINTFDCIVSPHCCEGWGLVLSHSMLLGKPVIATKYSGNMDFANEHNSYLVPIGGLEKADDEMIALNENYRGVTWPTISIEKLKRTMRYVYENKEDACMIGKTAQDDIKQKYNYSETSSLFYKHITTILNEKNNSNNTSIQK